VRFSVVIPAHNGEAFITQALESVVAQTRPADEILVVDDASTDGTGDLAKSSRWDGRVRYIRNDVCTGFADAWNRCARLASGDFVVLLHQDDLLAPDYLLHTTEAFKRFPQAQHLYAGCAYIDAVGQLARTTPAPHRLEPTLYSGREYAARYLKGVEANHHIHRCPGVATARSLIVERCPYRKEAGLIADDDFFLRIGAFTDVIGISQPLASHRIHLGSVIGQERSLVQKLARDWMQQVKWHVHAPGILDSGDGLRIQRLAVRFINLLLFESIAERQGDSIREALAMRQEFESVHPGLFEKLAKPWGRILWLLNGERSHVRPAAVFWARLVQVGVKWRDAMAHRIMVRPEAHRQ
jgi:glycosyltransferase involved in cell wall biosynthesis